MSDRARKGEEYFEKRWEKVAKDKKNNGKY